MSIVRSMRLWRLAALAVLLIAFSVLLMSGTARADHKGTSHGRGGGLTDDLIVTACMVSGADCVSVGETADPHIHVTVNHAVVGPVKGAKVVLTITHTQDNNIVEIFHLKRTSNSDGVAHFEKKGNSDSEDPGTYTIDATATKDEASGECIGCLVVQVESDGTITVV